MKKALVRNGALLPFSDVFHTTPTGITVSRKFTEEEWTEFGLKLGVCEGALNWWIGDWAALGGKVEHGIKSEAYNEIIEKTGLGRNTITITKYVSEAVDLLIRINKLSWSHHRAVAHLDQAKQIEWLKKAEDNDWSVAELRREIKKASFQELPLPDGKYRVIYADPPWEYGAPQHVAGDGRSAQVAGSQETVLETHYPTMALEQICAMDVKEIAADSSVLFLWATSPLLPQSLQVVEAWGFKYKASIIWDKVRHNVGYYVSVRHEFLLIATKDSCLPDSDKLHDSVISIERTEHSRKPDYFRELIDTMYVPNKHRKDRIELFARKEIPEHWDGWGNQHGK